MRPAALVGQDAVHSRPVDSPALGDGLGGSLARRDRIHRIRPRRTHCGVRAWTRAQYAALRARHAHPRRMGSCAQPRNGRGTCPGSRRSTSQRRLGACGGAAGARAAGWQGQPQTAGVAAADTVAVRFAATVAAAAAGGDSRAGGLPCRGGWTPLGQRGVSAQRATGWEWQIACRAAAACGAPTADGPQARRWRRRGHCMAFPAV
mmetsp:Transcript_17829/g.56350  ORF Transcript_17829/g.56350 Transcript_17829/m.56350 type:complete len:205 (-) Transcript_17829:399-1013(-)